MCGCEYSTYTDDEPYVRYLAKRAWCLPLDKTIPEFKHTFNACPAQEALVFCVRDGRLGFHSMRWGLISSWTKSIMSVAGVWEEWVDKASGEAVDSFALLTTAPNAPMKEIHDRMPLILAEEDEARRLDPELTKPADVADLLKPCPADWLTAHKVSPLVISPRNNSAKIHKLRQGRCILSGTANFRSQRGGGAPHRAPSRS